LFVLQKDNSSLQMHNVPNTISFNALSILLLAATHTYINGPKAIELYTIYLGNLIFSSLPLFWQTNCKKPSAPMVAPFL